MASINDLLLGSERLEREAKHVNAQLPGVRGTKPGTLYITDRRVIFRSKVLFRETVYDVALDRIADVVTRADGLSAGHLDVRTVGGDVLRLRVKYNQAAALASTIRALQ